MKRTIRFATTALAAMLALAGGLAVRASTSYVKDVMLVCEHENDVEALMSTYLAQGWECIDYDLNASGNAYFFNNNHSIYMLVKREDSEGVNFNYITDFYIKTGDADVAETLVFSNKTYHLVNYVGDTEFTQSNGDLNFDNDYSSATAVRLYYTRDTSSGHAVTNVLFNRSSQGAVCADGGTDPCNLNKRSFLGSSKDAYMHYSTATASMTVNLGTLTNDCTLISGMTLTGTLTTNVGVYIASNSTVTLDGAVIGRRSNYAGAGITCLGDARLILKGTNYVSGSNGPGIYVPPGSTLSVDNSPGCLYALGDGNSAGIGGGGSQTSCGNIVLDYCTVTAEKGGYALYSIGSAESGTCGTVTIGGVATGCISQSPVTYSAVDANVYTVTFDANGGTGTMPEMEFRMDTPREIPPAGSAAMA